jgi:hypothetical protein
MDQPQEQAVWNIAYKNLEHKDRRHQYRRQSRNSHQSKWTVRDTATANRDGWLSEGKFQVPNVSVRRTSRGRVSQGDIFRDVEYIEYALEKSGILEVSKIVFPLIAVLTQDCDLEQDARYRKRNGSKPSNDDKRLISVLVAPLYNAAHVFSGQHLSDLKLSMTPINEKNTEGRFLKQNERPRYHYLEFPQNVPIVPSIADFKHYFSVNIQYLMSLRRKQFVCSLSEMFREDLSQHFAGYLARIGLPEHRAMPSVPSPPRHVS